jgi:hypothetical protein
LTGLVAAVLLFRYGVKAWVYFALPTVSSPERVWGLEDIFYAVGFVFDILHMSLIQKSKENGLGRHFGPLSPEEKGAAMKWNFASQPVGMFCTPTY